MLSRKYQLLLIITILLSVFYPSLSAELNSIDDVEMTTNLLNMNGWSLRGLFFPAAGGGLYYRPLLYGTFIFDRFAWEADSSFMHLENILLHLLSAVLVYFLTRELLSHDQRDKSLVPLAAALCFGLHPIVTESVNWVSGRTDLMAGVFVLTSALFLLKFKAFHQKKYLYLSLLTLVLGMLCKEVALLFLPGGVLILAARNPHDVAVPIVRSLRHQVKRLVLYAMIGGSAIAVFFLMRSLAYTSNSSRIGMTIKFIQNDPVHALFVVLRAFGFYFKKFFLPLPLNFAIVEVDPLYELLAMLVIVLCIYIAWRRTILSAIFLSGLFMLVPAFPIAFNQVAWTPYAERYMYIGTAFVVSATVTFAASYLRTQRLNEVGTRCGICVLLLIMAVATFSRNLTWRSNITLFTDTARKSPTFTKAWNQLGIAYYEKKDYRNAEIYFAKASSLYEWNVDEKSDVNLAVVLVKQGKIKEAEEVYARLMKTGGQGSEKVVDHYVNFLNDRIAEEKNGEKKAEIRKAVLTAYQVLYAANKNPVTLYKIGNAKNQLGDRQGARAAYLTAFEMFPDNDTNRRTISQQLVEMAKK